MLPPTRVLWCVPRPPERREEGAMPAPDGLPTYAELSERSDAPRGTNWGLFGADDQLGTINFLSPERVVAARDCIRKGVSFGLNWRIDLPDPPLFGRGAHRHTVVQIANGVALDDYL